MKQGARFHQTLLMSSNEKLLAARHAEFVKNAGEVVSHGRGTNTETLGDVLVRESLPNQLDDLTFAFGHGVRGFQR